MLRDSKSYEEFPLLEGLFFFGFWGATILPFDPGFLWSQKSYIFEKKTMILTSCPLLGLNCSIIFVDGSEIR